MCWPLFDCTSCEGINISDDSHFPLRTSIKGMLLENVVIRSIPIQLGSKIHISQHSYSALLNKISINQPLRSCHANTTLQITVSRWIIPALSDSRLSPQSFNQSFTTSYPSFLLLWSFGRNDGVVGDGGNEVVRQSQPHRRPNQLPHWYQADRMGCSPPCYPCHTLTHSVQHPRLLAGYVTLQNEGCTFTAPEVRFHSR